MRLSLTARQEPGHRIPGCKGPRVTDELDSPRDQAAAATETVTLVLHEDSPLPETPADVEYLARRLRGHISQLGVVVPKEEPALCKAQRLGSLEIPDGYMPSRVHLVQLAEATKELVATVGTHGPGLIEQRRRRRWWKPRINVVRGVVFALAFALLVLAASVPQT